MPAARAELGNLRTITRSFRPISQQYGIGDLALFAHMKKVAQQLPQRRSAGAESWKIMHDCA